MSIRAVSQGGTVKNEHALSQTDLRSNPRGVSGMVCSTLPSFGFSLCLRRRKYLPPGVVERIKLNHGRHARVVA